MKKRTKNILKWIGTVVIAFVTIHTYHEPESVNMKGLEIPVDNHSKGQIVQRTGYTLSYNTDNRTPQWVAWELTKEETYGDEERSDEFMTDPKIKGKQADTYDYSRSGYDRGHMAPAGDMKWSSEAMQESFYMSNICPQDHNLNKGDWNDLEMLTREWARRYGRAYVVCGPIYEKGKQTKRIGKNKVAVPHAFFKAILINRKDSPIALGFYFENQPGHKRLENYLISIDCLEENTGLDFFANLPDETEEQIEQIKASRLP